MRNQSSSATAASLAEIWRVTLVGAGFDLVLGIAKLITGVIGHSQALVIDGVHSLSDLGTDVLVLVAAGQAHRDADLEHPYGHERIQTAASVVLGLALIAVAAGIAVNAVGRMFHPERLQAPAMATLAVAFVSVLCKEAIYHYTMRSARRLNSRLLKANAWHSRSDALSSIVVIVGIAGVMAGLNYLDAVAAVIVAALVVQAGWSIGWDALRELVDTGVEKSKLEAMRHAMLDIEGVRDVHRLRTRRMGPQVLADVHVRVAPQISVSEGHRIADEVEARLTGKFNDVHEIMVHIDPEDDDTGPPSSHLPLRREVIAQLNNTLRAAGIERPPARVVLHYLHGRLMPELWFALSDFASLDEARALADRIQRALAADALFAETRVGLQKS